VSLGARHYRHKTPSPGPRAPRWYRERLAELKQTSEEIAAMMDRRELQHASSADIADPWVDQADEDEIEALRSSLLAIGEEMAVLREGWKTITSRSRRVSV